MSWASTAAAQEPAKTPNATLSKADTAWNKGNYAGALPLYEKALERGGLPRDQVIQIYLRMGVVRTALGNQNQALSAFRVAAMLDPHASLPQEANGAAKKLFAQAQKETKEQGGALKMTTKVPDKVPGGKAFKAEVNLQDIYAPLLDKIRIRVTDPDGSAFKAEKQANSSVIFDVPGKSVPSGKKLSVVFRGVDPQGNEWVRLQKDVQTGGKAKPAKAAPVPPLRDDEEPPPPKKEEKGKSFWATPWPYVIGGAVLLGGAGAVLLGGSSDEVQVGAPGWR